MDQWTKSPMVQWTNGPMVQWTNRPLVQWTNGPMDQLTNGPMDPWINGPRYSHYQKWYLFCSNVHYSIICIKWDFLVLWGFLSVFLWANMVLCSLVSDLSSTWRIGTCHPRQCSSPDCRGTQLIRHGNDGSMPLTSESFSGRVFPSCSFSPSARDPFTSSECGLFEAFPLNLPCFYWYTKC